MPAGGRLEVDVLGHVYQVLQHTGARSAGGEFFTPTPIADLMAAMTLGSDPKPGQSICEPAAGAGSMFRGAAKHLLSLGHNPADYHWYAVDVDPVIVAALVVNVHCWDLGPHVVIGCADTLAEGDWQMRAAREQADAITRHQELIETAAPLAAWMRAAAAVDALCVTRSQPPASDPAPARAALRPLEHDSGTAEQDTLF
jgi:hypothetical protein